MIEPPRPADPLDATVLICSRERANLLGDTVRSVLDANAVPAELVVIDQSASPHARLSEMDGVRGCTVRYLHSPGAGLSRARNLGLRKATHDVVVLIDDDMLVDEAWLPSLLEGLPSARHCVATGRVLPAPDEGLGAIVPAAALVTRGSPAVYRGPEWIDVMAGANVAVRRDFVLGLGGYDERLGPGTRFGAAEDNDFGYRLLRAGGEVHYLPTAVVFHRAWRSQGELVALRWRYGRGKGAFYAKHVGSGDRRLQRRAATDVGTRLKRGARAAVRAPRTTVGELVSLGGMASGALDWLVRERIAGRYRERNP